MTRFQLFIATTLAAGALVILGSLAVRAQTVHGGAAINPGFLVVTAIDNTTTAPHWLAFGGADINLTQGDIKTRTPVDLICTEIRVNLRVAPGAGDTWTVSLEDDGTDTALSCAMTGAGSGDGVDQCDDSDGGVEIAAGSLVRWHFAETGTAADPDRWFLVARCIEDR